MVFTLRIFSIAMLASTILHLDSAPPYETLKLCKMLTTFSRMRPEINATNCGPLGATLPLFHSYFCHFPHSDKAEDGHAAISTRRQFTITGHMAGSPPGQMCLRTMRAGNTPTSQLQYRYCSNGSIETSPFRRVDPAPSRGKGGCPWSGQHRPWSRR